MKTETRELSPARQTLVVTLEPAEIEEVRTELVRDFSRQVRVPGFRPGKVPPAVVRQRFGRQIDDELAGRVAGRAYEDGVKQAGLDVVSIVDSRRPDLRPGEPATFEFDVDVRVAFDLPDYQGLPLVLPDMAVTDADVERALDGLRRERARFEPVERAVQAGDFVRVSYEGTSEGTPVADLVPENPLYGKAPLTWEEAGSTESLVPGLSLALVGLAKGDQREVPVTFPQDFSLEALRGRPAVYKVEVLEVRERVLPALDDPELLRATGAESAAALLANARGSLERRRESEAYSLKRQQASERLASLVDFPVPESLVDNEAQEVLRGFMKEQMRLGMPETSFEDRKQELIDGARRAALVRVKVRLILARIIEREGLKLEEDDMRRALVLEARRAGEDPNKYAKRIVKDRDALGALQRSVLLDKALDFVIRAATVTTAAPDEASGVPTVS